MENKNEAIKQYDGEITSSGVFGTRGLCVLWSIFALTYILECFEHVKLSVILILLGLCGVIYCKKAILDFWVVNKWNGKFCVAFLSIHFILTGIYGIICFVEPSLLLITFDERIPLVGKLGLCLLYLGLCRSMLVADNWWMKKISENHKVLEAKSR